jgi:hypothetical protein
VGGRCHNRVAPKESGSFAQWQYHTGIDRVQRFFSLYDMLTRWS